MKPLIKKFFFDHAPALKVECMSLSTSHSSTRKIKAACQRRMYSLLEDWTVDVNAYSTDKLNGQILIPAVHQGVKQIFDGASVPIPWLFSAVTFGIARPMGVMLTASIIHDFAYDHGYLLVKKQDEEVYTETYLERHEADALFRDLMIDVTHMPKTSYLGWMVLRMGWFCVDYAGKKRGGVKPYFEILPLITLVISFIGFLFLTPKILLAILMASYLAIWFRISN